MATGTTAITNALVDLLAGDATLAGLAPDGVYFGAAPPHAARFVVVLYAHGVAVGEFGGRAYEDKYYAVKAVMRKTGDVDLATAQAAATRIETILDRAVLLAPGYSCMSCIFEEALEPEPDVDDSDDSVRWYQSGGIYRVQMSCD